MEVPLLHDMVVIFGLSILVILLCHLVRLPSIVGFLITGVVGGPHGLALINNESDVQILANIGIVLLLFVIGMEFSIKKIMEYKRFFLIGGTLQVGLTTVAGFVIGRLAGSPSGESIFLGFLLSLSSTAIVLRLLQEKMETDTPHGRVIMGMMIFQDVAAIPMILLAPLLAGIHQTMNAETLLFIAKGFIVLAVVLVSAVKLVPNILYYIARTKSRELFLLSVVTICSSVAWLTSSIGLSMSLGAFLAGLIISDSDYRSEAIGDILPFQDIFTSFFFVSIGMLLDVEFFLDRPFYLTSIAAGIILLKAVLAGGAALVLRLPLRPVVLVGIAMAQIGEFSFVLCKSGAEIGLGSSYHHQLFLTVALLSMAFTPTLIYLSPFIASLILKLPFPARLKSGLEANNKNGKSGYKDHLIIVGFGISGRNLARSSRETGVPYLILEMNAETVKNEKRNGEPIHFGDASHHSVLHHANISEAKTIAVVINDSHAVARIVETARKLNPKLYIIVRTRYLIEAKEIYHLGADDVIPDEFGSSIEIFTRVLRKYQVPTEQVQKIVTDMRTEGYELLRHLYKEPVTLKDLQMILSNVLIETFQTHKGAPITNKTLGEINLRKNFDVTAMLIKRGAEIITSLNAETRFFDDDIVVLVGSHENLTKANSLFKRVS